MKSNKILLLLFLLLGGIATYFLVIKKEKKTNFIEQFTLEDTAAVAKIIINTPDFTGLSLVKSKSGWVMNTRVIADPLIVSQLLNTAKRVKVSYGLPKDQNEYVKKEIKKNGSKITYYDAQDKVLKEYWVGKATPDNKATYFWSELDDRVKVCAIEGFDGFLEYRYRIDEKEWRDRTVFNTDLSQIKKLTVKYPEQPNSSFEIEVYGRDSFTIKKLATSEVTTAGLNRQKVLQYMTFFKKIYCEGYNNENPRRDSILASVPLVDFTLEEFTGKVNHVKLYHREINKRSKVLEDKLGNPLKYDVDRYWGNIHDGQDLVVVQQFSAGKLLKEYSEFFDQRSQ